MKILTTEEFLALDSLEKQKDYIVKLISLLSEEDCRIIVENLKASGKWPVEKNRKKEVEESVKAE